MSSDNEIPNRLAPTRDILRELYLKSGNLCAFPDCTALMMDEKGIFIGQICHIEAAETVGPRFNPAQTNEERRAFSNLMLMCYPHHKITDNEKEYPVAKLSEMKRTHEQKFSDPARAMLETLKVWTAHHEPSFARSLKAANEGLAWGLTEGQLAENLRDINAFASRLRNVPVESRKILSLLAARAYRLKQGMKPARRHRYHLLLKDAQAALQLNDRQFRTHLDILSHHGMAAPEQDDDGNWVISLYTPDVAYVLDILVEFAEKKNLPIDQFFIEMRFDLLDA